MINLLALVLIVSIGYWVINTISRKKRELEQKELQQSEQFLKETKALLNAEVSPSSTPQQTCQSNVTPQYRQKVAEHFQAEGYTITEISKAEGIDLIGIKEKELILIRCEEKIKEIKKSDLKLFIAECSVYIDNNPIFKGRLYTRIFATNRAITDEARKFARENSLSIRLHEIF